jgi:hypothetical protein
VSQSILESYKRYLVSGLRETFGPPRAQACRRHVCNPLRGDRRAWVGSALDLSTICTRRSFALRQGIEPNPALQSAWNAQGPESFAFKILEEIDLDELTYGRARSQGARCPWREALGDATAV